MIVKFNLFERVAGIFVLVAIGSAVVATVGMGIKKGWFESKVGLTTVVKTADGLYPGTPVNFSGLRIGAVDSVELKTSDMVEVHFKVRKQFIDRINTGSIVRITRPFIIGEKALEIESKSLAGNPVKEGSVLLAEYAPDFLDLLGGNKLGAYMESLSSTVGNLQKLAEAFLSNERSDKMIELFDQIFPLMEQMHQMASEVSVLSASLNDKKKLSRVLDDFLIITKEMNKTLPQMTQDMPQLSKSVLKLTQSLNQLTTDMSEIVPMMKEVAPEIPMATRKAVHALDETVLTLKAMQKTWMLRGKVEEVMEEEKRTPASGK
jgi:phospholipid/cholesterol/gamma-HCH transport system substrate-binding protein